MTEIQWMINDIPIFLTRKKIKNLYIRIKAPEAKVMVSVPVSMPDAYVKEFITKQWDWIRKKRKEILDTERTENRAGGRQYISGEVHDLWGMPYELTVERSLKKPLTEMREDKIYMRVTAHSTREERRRQLDQWYQEQIAGVLPGLVGKYEQIVGQHASEWHFRRMKTRWGSCNIQKKRICLNIQLAQMPVECLEYVIVHELTHLHEAGHNKRFWGLVDEFYPKWREVKRSMNHA